MKLALAAEGEWELGSLPDPDADDSVGRVVIDRIIAGTYPARGISWHRLKNSGDEVRAHRTAHGEAYTAALMYSLAVDEGCDGLVVLRDADRETHRRDEQNRKGLVEAAARATRRIPAVLGLEIRTLEAWLLADAGAFVKVLGNARPALPRSPEELWGKVNDRRSNHPKVVLERLVRRAGKLCDRHLAARLAEAADLDVIARECPQGFGAFKRDLEQAFRPFDCVVAADAAGGIGRANDLPWPKLKGDLKFLRETTSAAAAGKRNAVIMGRKTWESVPAKFRPLPGRLNIVISRQSLDLRDAAIASRSLDEALNESVLREDVDRIFVIGGAEIFRMAFAHPRCRDVYLTRIEATYDCDAFLPALDDFELVETIATNNDAGVDYRIERWRRRARC